MPVDTPFQPDRFYEYEPNENILCGDCAKEDVEKTLSGEYKGDEAVFAKDFRLLTDDDVEPYQCDLCNKQNEAYENLGEDEDDD